MKLRNGCQINWLTTIFVMPLIVPAMMVLGLAWVIISPRGMTFRRWMDWSGDRMDREFPVE